MLKADFHYRRACIYLEPLNHDVTRSKFEKSLELKVSRNQIYFRLNNNALVMDILTKVPKSPYDKEYGKEFIRRAMDLPEKEVLQHIRKLSKEKIIGSIQNLLGDIEPSLERCAKFFKDEKVSPVLVFMPEGLADPSDNWRNASSDSPHEEKFPKHITTLVNDAKNYETSLPKSLEIPEGISIEYVPTFQKLKEMPVPKEIVYYNLPSISLRATKVYNVITGETFADCIDNFFTMYEAVEKHKSWETQERQRLKAQGIENPVPKVARLILPSSE